MLTDWQYHISYFIYQFLCGELPDSFIYVFIFFMLYYTLHSMTWFYHLLVKWLTQNDWRYALVWVCKSNSLFHICLIVQHFYLVSEQDTVMNHFCTQTTMWSAVYITHNVFSVMSYCELKLRVNIQLLCRFALPLCEAHFLLKLLLLYIITQVSLGAIVLLICSIVPL